MLPFPRSHPWHNVFIRPSLSLIIPSVSWMHSLRSSIPISAQCSSPLFQQPCPNTFRLTDFVSHMYQSSDRGSVQPLVSTTRLSPLTAGTGRCWAATTFRGLIRRTVHLGPPMASGIRVSTTFLHVLLWLLKFLGRQLNIAPHGGCMRAITLSPSLPSFGQVLF